jgi:nucleoside transporter
MSEKMRLRIMLSAMMFFQYASWGAWAPVLGATLGNDKGIFHATGTEIGNIFGIIWLACIFVPFVGGQLVDRLMPSQIFIGIAAAVCGGSALMMAQQTTVAGLVPWMWLWSIAFAPTVGIANSICLYHLSRVGMSEPEREKEFAFIRTVGTVGWIVVAFLLLAYMKSGTKVGVPEMMVAGFAGIIWAVISFLLPNIPPRTGPDINPFAFTKAFSLFKSVPGFTAFILISLVASAEFQFFYTLSGQFLGSLGVAEEYIAPYKSISQIAEVLALAFLLPIALKKFGMRWTLVIGTLAWSLRYFIFATKVFLPVVASLSLHGIGFAFVFITSYFYIDRVAPKDIRASAQSLYTLITLGVGNWLGTFVSGRLQDYFTTTEGVTKMVNWPLVFIVPATLTLVSAIAFALTFKEPTSHPDEQANELETAR